jgi:hypothetical protein
LGWAQGRRSLSLITSKAMENKILTNDWLLYPNLGSRTLCVGDLTLGSLGTNLFVALVVVGLRSRVVTLKGSRVKWLTHQGEWGQDESRGPTVLEVELP